MGGFTTTSRRAAVDTVAADGRRAFVMEPLPREQRIVQQPVWTGLTEVEGVANYVFMLEVHYDTLLATETNHARLHARRKGVHEQHALIPSLALG